VVIMTRLSKLLTCLWLVIAYRARKVVAILVVLALCLLAGRAFALDPVGNFDILIYANQDYELNLIFKTDGVPENLTGRSYKLQAKKTGATAPFLNFSSTVVNAATGQTR